MTTYDDATLLAYLDGELAAAESETLEADLARDARLAERLQAFAGSGALLRAALAPATHGRLPPLPEPDLTERRAASWRAFAPHAAIAASIALLIGAGLGFGTGDFLARRNVELAGEQRARDAAIAEATLRRALETQVSGTPVSWQNPDSGASGTVKPTRTFKNHSDQFCREYERVEKVGARTETVSGIACRGDDGQWRTRAVFFRE
jgi:anti-sigma factor RsiW